ncbi:MAG: PQQ-binding-like beta-propeller repeat protein, partial [bacterium]
LPLGDPAKDTAVSITVDAVLAENKVTGTFTGSVVDSKVKGDLSGSIRSLFASFGGRDFYPSPEHPVGFRGDGNGYFPGATPVTEWQEGTLAVQKAPAGSRAKDVTYVADEKGGKNIVWKTEMPAWVNSEPIVVGDRIFTCGEPNLLICADANTGKVLWSHRMSVFQAMGLNAETTERCQTLADIYQVTFDAAKYHMLELSKSKDWKTGGETATAMAEKVIPRISEELKKIDPTFSYDAAIKTVIDGYTEFAKLLATNTIPLKNTGIEDKALGVKLSALNGLLKNRIATFAKIKADELAMESPWGNIIGWQMSVPVSDGQYVYASFGQGATACYDLTGNLIWARYMPLFKNKGGTATAMNTVQSPVLADGVLVDMHGGTRDLVGLDAKTGKELWRAPTKGDFAFGIDRGGYFVGSHKVIALPDPDGKPVNILVTSLCNIIRIKDGKVLGVIPYDAGPASGGPSMINSGDIVVKGMVGDAQNKPFVAYKIAFDGPDKVVGKEVWRLPKTSEGYNGLVATPSYFILLSKETIVDPQDGKVITAMDRNLGGHSNLLIGKHYFWDLQTKDWPDGRTAGNVTTRIGVADMSDPKKPRKLPINYIGGKNMPRCIEYERYAPELLAIDGFWGGWAGRPSGSTCADTVIFPTGNRIFIRTTADLYCIGDPSVP